MERRALLKLLSLAPLSSLAATPGCATVDPMIGDDERDGEGECALTPADVEGPYYTANAPAREQLASATEPGEPLLLTGRLLAEGCATPLVGHILDVWHADDQGVYDLEGYKLRGVFATDAEGRFTIETILPGRYPDRPVRHIHLKLRDPSGEELLTTQIYFEGDPELADVHTGPRARLEGGIAEVELVLPGR